MEFKNTGREKNENYMQETIDTEKAYRIATRRRKQKIKRKVLMCTMSVFFVCSLIVALSCTVLFNVKQIKVTGIQYLQPGQVMQASGVQSGDNLVTTRTEEVAKSVETNIGSVDSVTVTKTFPNTINIDIVESIPLVAIYSSGKYIIVDKNGQVLSISDTYDELPIICGVQLVTPVVGQKFTTGNQNLDIEILNAYVKILADPAYKINYIDMTNVYSINAICNERFLVKYGSMVNIDYKLDFLNNVIVNELTAPDDIGEIDLSYLAENNPRVYFNKISIDESKNAMMQKCGVTPAAVETTPT